MKEQQQYLRDAGLIGGPTTKFIGERTQDGSIFYMSPPSDTAGSGSIFFVTSSTNESVLQNPDPHLEAELEELFANWREETKHLSLAYQKAMNFSYQQIIGKGKDAIPFILKKMKERQGQWFWALYAIVQRDVAANIEDYDEAVSAWLSWGRKNRYI